MGDDAIIEFTDSSENLKFNTCLHNTTADTTTNQQWIEDGSKLKNKNIQINSLVLLVVLTTVMLRLLLRLLLRVQY